MMRTGLLGEFATAKELLAAVVALRQRGYRRLEAYTPYPIHGLERALGMTRSPLPWVALLFGIIGAGLAYFLQLWCNHDYPLNIGGRPLHSAPAFIPITFEMGVLAASLTALLAFLFFSRLPELYSPVFDVDGFERASIDRFWLGVDDRDPAFDPHPTRRELLELGALSVARAKERRR